MKPSRKDYEKLVNTILSGGDFQGGAGWGGRSLKFGGYYGAGTIQGMSKGAHAYICIHTHIHLYILAY